MNVVHPGKRSCIKHINNEQYYEEYIMGGPLIEKGGGE